MVVIFTQFELLIEPFLFCYSLLDALDLMGGGVQNLVVPISHHSLKLRETFTGSNKPIVSARSISLDSSCIPSSLNSHDGQEYCWLTQEDMLRFLLGSIGVFDPIPSMNLSELEVIRTDIDVIDVDDDATSALETIKFACHAMRPVAVVNKSSRTVIKRKQDTFTLVGEISCSSMQICNEVAALALATLSAGDFLIYTQVCKNPPDTMVDIIRMRVCKKISNSNGSWQLQQSLPKLNEVNQMLKDLDSRDEFGNSCSDDEHSRGRGSFHIAKLKGSIKRPSSGPVFCNPTSSLIAVILQCLAHREDHVWVLGNDDDDVIGVVTFSDILTVILKHSINFTAH
jgi:hypothetical protein